SLTARCPGRAVARFAVSVGYFFFSSRRRHTRFSRDWSSDVCSSDLVVAKTSLRQRFDGNSQLVVVLNAAPLHAAGCTGRLQLFRSEERRVGKECRSRWAAEQANKNDVGEQVALSRSQSVEGVYTLRA